MSERMLIGGCPNPACHLPCGLEGMTGVASHPRHFCSRSLCPWIQLWSRSDVLALLLLEAAQTTCDFYPGMNNFWENEKKELIFLMLSKGDRTWSSDRFELGGKLCLDPVCQSHKTQWRWVSGTFERLGAMGTSLWKSLKGQWVLSWLTIKSPIKGVFLVYILVCSNLKLLTLKNKVLH